MRNYNRFKYQTRKKSFKAFLNNLPEDYDYNYVDKYHETLLIAAICNNNIELIKILLERDADINGDRRAKYYPIEIASLNGSTEIVRLLCILLDLLFHAPADAFRNNAALCG